MQVTADNLDEVTREASRRYQQQFRDKNYDEPSPGELTAFESGFMTGICEAIVDVKPHRLQSWHLCVVASMSFAAGWLANWEWLREALK